MILSWLKLFTWHGIRPIAGLDRLCCCFLIGVWDYVPKSFLSFLCDNIFWNTLSNFWIGIFFGFLGILVSRKSSCFFKYSSNFKEHFIFADSAPLLFKYISLSTNSCNSPEGKNSFSKSCIMSSSPSNEFQLRLFCQL